MLGFCLSEMKKILPPRSAQGQDDNSRLACVTYVRNATQGRYFAGVRRGRCFFETDRMISLPRPTRGKGVLACATAASMRA